MCKISRDYALTAIHILANLLRKQTAQPLRFVYMSGHFASREKTGHTKVLDDHGILEYSLLRVGAGLDTVFFPAPRPRGVT